MTLIRRISKRIAALPNWLQPAAVGAVLLFGAVAPGMLAAVPFLFLFRVDFTISAYLVLASESALAAVSSGAIGGLAYSLIGRPLRRVPVVGRYLAGIVCVAAYLAPLMLCAGRLWGDDAEVDFHETSQVVIWLGVVLIYGVIMGHTWFKPIPATTISGATQDGGTHPHRR